MKKIKLIRVLYLSLLMIIVISGHSFSKSKGLVLKGYDKGVYVTELLSSGSDDNITIEFSVILFIPVMILSLFRINKPINLFEYIFNNFASLLQIMFLFFIEAGSIFNTIIYEQNKSLWAWSISIILFICVTQFFYFYYKCNKNHQPQRQKVAE